MCGGFASLAQQGFLTAFPAREAQRAEREALQNNSEKDAVGGLFRHTKPPPNREAAQTIDKLSREAGVCFLVAKPKGKWSKGVEYIAKNKGAETHAAR